MSFSSIRGGGYTEKACDSNFGTHYRKMGKNLAWLGCKSMMFTVQGADLEQGPRQDPDGEESGQVTWSSPVNNVVIFISSFLDLQT